VYSFWTIVKTILDKCQVSKHRSRNELRTRGGRAGSATAAVHSLIPISRHFFPTDDESSRLSFGDGLPVRQATARQKARQKQAQNENHKGRKIR
jgi:hypothetical protein